MNVENNLHQPVLLKECLKALAIKKDGCYVDATLGRGGHSFAILERLGEQGCLLAFDKDKAAIDYVQSHCGDSRLRLIHQSFSTLTSVLTKAGLMGCVQGILMDLGISSPQLNNKKRGFSFQNDGPLDMRMDSSAKLTAAAWLAKANANEIADVLYRFGEEKKSRAIARAIKKAQQQEAIISTKQLADIVVGVIPKYQKKHPATRTFQALRIFINQELAELGQILLQLIDCLAINGRLAIISFHSLEDRMVKQFIKGNSEKKHISKYLAATKQTQTMPLKSLGRYFASPAEVHDNIRARSAVLRVAEKIANKQIVSAN